MLWFGTKKGLNRINPLDSTFEYVNLNPGNSRGITNISVTAICEDREKNLWVGTSQGLYTIRKINNLSNKNVQKPLRVESDYYSALDPSSLGSDYIRSLYVDKFGTVWVGTFGRGLYRYIKETNSFTNHSSNSRATKFSQIGNFISDMYEDSKHNFWIAAYDSGLWIYNRELDKFYRCLNEPVMTLYEDMSGIIWAGTYTSGVRTYDPRKNNFKYYFENPANPNDKNINLITSIIEDDIGNLWVGTYNSGLRLYTPPSVKTNYQRKKIEHLNLNLEILLVLAAAKSLQYVNQQMGKFG